MIDMMNDNGIGKSAASEHSHVSTPNTWFTSPENTVTTTITTTNTPDAAHTHTHNHNHHHHHSDISMLHTDSDPTSGLQHQASKHHSTDSAMTPNELSDFISDNSKLDSVSPSSTQMSHSTHNNSHTQLSHLAHTTNSHHHEQAQAAQISHEELNNWTDFTNLAEADLNALEEQLSMLNNNSGDNRLRNQQHQEQEQEQQQHQRHQHQQPQQQQQHHHHHQNDEDPAQYAEFSHTAFPPVETHGFELDTSHAMVVSHEDNNSDPSSSTTSAVRPDLIFTPLVSPAVTPMDKTSQFHHNHHQQHRHSSAASNAPDTNGMFSPLTSPALEFQQMKSSPVMRIKKDSYDDYPSSSSTSTTSSHHHHHHKRRSSSTTNSKTPGSTPIVGPSMPGRVSKASPVVKPKRQSAFTGKYLGEMTLPESSMDFKTPSSVPKRTKEFHQQQPQQQQQQPQQHHHYNHHHQQQQQQQMHDENGHAVTPATLMNFKMDGKDDEQLQLQQQQQQQQTVILNTNRAHSNSSSPVILPSSTTPIMGPRRSSSVTKRHSRRNSSSSSTNTLIAGGGGGSGGSGNIRPTDEAQEPQENQLDKKTNHKLAEQGRRNRMNTAIQSLDKLIPMEWKKDVLVPSKATTIEIAIEYLKYLQGDKNSHSADTTNDSISPLD